jgi:hypothetical protein
MDRNTVFIGWTLPFLVWRVGFATLPAWTIDAQPGENGTKTAANSRKPCQLLLLVLLESVCGARAFDWRSAPDLA